MRRLLGVLSLVKKHGPAAFGVRVTRTPLIPMVVRALVEQARAGTAARPGSV